MNQGRQQTLLGVGGEHSKYVRNESPHRDPDKAMKIFVSLSKYGSPYLSRNSLQLVMNIFVVNYTTILLLYYYYCTVPNHSTINRTKLAVTTAS